MSELLRRLFLYRHAMNGIPAAAPTIPCQLEPLTESTLPRLREVWPVFLDDMKARLERGDLCVIAIVDGRVAHYSWAQFSGQHEIRDVGQRVEVQRGHAWVYHCRTADWAKGRGIYPFVLTRILTECKARNIQSAWIYAGAENVASRRGIERAGFLLYKRLIAVNLFSRKISIAHL